MIAAVRRQQIKDIVFEKKSATVTELARRFDVTDETIRRDLKALEKDGALMRTYGGAFIQTGVDNLVEANIRTGVYVDGKSLIARRCRPFIHNGDIIFLDNSTTDYYIAKEIQDMRLTIVTNNLMIMNLVASVDNLELVAIGGNFSPTEKAFYGNIAIQTLGNYFVDAAFFSPRSLSIENGITDASDQWALVRKTAIEHSNRNYLAVDFSKFDNTSYARICGFEKIDGIITERPRSERWHDAMRAYDCLLVDGTEDVSPEG